jgi:hypothetical protein
VRQVLIEARIVEASDTFGKSLGVRLGGGVILATTRWGHGPRSLVAARHRHRHRRAAYDEDINLDQPHRQSARHQQQFHELAGR